MCARAFLPRALFSTIFYSNRDYPQANVQAHLHTGVHPASRSRPCGCDEPEAAARLDGPAADSELVLAAGALDRATELASDRPASCRWPVYEEARSGRRHSKMMPRAVSNTAAGVRSSSSRPKGLTWQSPGGQRANSLDLMSDHRTRTCPAPRAARRTEKFGEENRD